MWTVIYLAHDSANAARIYGSLKNDGISVRMRPAGRESKEGYEILVPEKQTSAAHSIIFGRRA